MEKNSLDELYELYVADIYRYLRSLCQDHHAAEDLMQETFYRAYLYLEDCNEERIKHWLSVGAQPTDRVARFLDAAGLRKRDARNNPKKALPGKKRQEREAAAKEAAEKAAAAAEPAAS